MNIKRKIIIIIQKLNNNWRDYITSNKIIDFQEKSIFIKFLREKLHLIKESDNFNSQLEKNLLRSIARFSEDLVHLAHLIFEEVSPHLKTKNFNPNYFMKPYLMIHLPNDKSEEGIMHSDYEFTEDGFVTCWAPLERYDYPALSSLGSFAQKLSSFPKTATLLKHFKEILICQRADPGDVRFWSQSYLHKGNRNTSNHTSFVLVTKLSKQPLSAGSYKILNNSLNENLYKDDTINLGQINYESMNKDFFEIAYELNEIVQNINFQKLQTLTKKTLKQFSIIELKILSFFLSVQAQRIWARPFYYEELDGLKINDGIKLWKTYDFFSISIGCENISSVQRLINTNYDFIPIKFIDEINKMMLEKDKFNLNLWNKIYVKSKSNN
jgi:hypothetical protein